MDDKQIQRLLDRIGSRYDDEEMAKWGPGVSAAPPIVYFWKDGDDGVVDPRLVRALVSRATWGADEVERLNAELRKFEAFRDAVLAGGNAEELVDALDIAEDPDW